MAAQDANIFLSFDNNFRIMTGLGIATVHQLQSSDTLHANRIQVSIPVNNGADRLLWARLVSSYSGAFFYPEIGDEVIIGFLNNNEEDPIILGSTLPGKYNNEVMPTTENYQKAFFSRSMLSVSFDDDKKTIHIKTPGGNSVELSDDEKTIALKDQHGNYVRLSSNGIELNSSSNILCKASGDITLSATGKIAVTAKQDVSVNAINIDHYAAGSFTAKGSASAELSASGQTTVKGAMVMIN
jgi:uncharacterized protein involved in type VI secretion and phage assembly